MQPKAIHAIVGLFVGAGVDLLINLLAAAIQQRAFADQFSTSSIGLLVILGVAGLLAGYWLGGQPPATVVAELAPSGKPKTTTVTRLKALLSYAKLRGKGIHIADILMIGSRLDIESED